MNYLSVCSGIEAASVAWEKLGWKCVGLSEIEPFPCEVLKQRYPSIKNYGDMLNYKEWNINEKIDLCVAGTPCQAFSIAGKRAGLADPRGNLMLSYIRIIELTKPRWFVWENVPGVLSSNGGRDFFCFIQGLRELGYDIAYRVLDAQWIRTQWHPRAVPQRRRRVFVVGSFGKGRGASEVLFDGESVQRHIKTRKETKERIATDFADCLRSGGKGGIAGSREGENIVINAFDKQAISVYGEGQAASSCMARDQKGFSDLVTSATPYDLFQITAPINKQSRDEKSPCHTLAKDNAAHAAIVIQGSVIGRKPENGPKNGTGWSSTGEVFTLNSTDIHAVALPAPAMQVRRLTPTECERLQGFPDGWTKIAWKKKSKDECPDGPRYKALGNSMAVNCMEWIGERIQALEDGKL